MDLKPLRRSFSSIVWWSVIAAAFIGPGTVTTAAKAGTDFGISLLWTLVFATFACFILQEAAARLRMISGTNIGESITCIFKNPILKFGVGLSVVFGCMAYQAGNILGAVEGLKMIWPGNRYLFILATFIISFLILFIGSVKWIVRILGILVASMGICFVYTIFKMETGVPINWSEALKLQIPDGSTMLIMGLIGTTIVPYNLFLGSGIARGNDIRSMRTGLFVSILIGGLITMAILIAGSFISGQFDFQILKNTVEQTSGTLVADMIAFGLFCAGLSSATTAPLAAAFTLQSLFTADNKNWKTEGRYFKITWLTVLTVGLIFSLLDFKPIPVIITAQILNGLILPIIAATLFIAINSPKCSGGYKNGILKNSLLLVVIITCVLLGVKSLWSVIF